MTPKFTSNPACDGKIFLLEITGIQHSDKQKIAFYDQTDMNQRIALEDTKKIDPELEDTTMYTWDWSAEIEPRNVWLSIDSDDEPILLPLYENVEAVKRKTYKRPQDYRVQSVVPISVLADLDSSKSELERMAPARSGFLYIAYKGKIWREIEISATQSGQFEFNDVNLYAYREGRDKPFKANITRESTGTTLNEIWFPNKDNGQSTDVRFAFSEVPLSAARLNYLEANPAELVLQFKALKCMPHHATELPEMRSRELGAEMSTAAPVAYNRDLSGEILTRCYQQAKKALTREGHFSNVEGYEYGAASSCLVEKLSESSGEVIDSNEYWKGEQSQNVLQDAHERHLRYIVLDDPIQELRQQVSTLQSAINYYQLLQMDAAKQPHFNSALLVNTFILPRQFGEADNPAHKYIDKLKRSDGSTYACSLRTKERKACLKDIEKLQKGLLKTLSSEVLINAFRDITSLDDANGLGAHLLVNQCNSLLITSPATQDQLLPESERKESKYLEDVCRLVSREENGALSKIVFPETPATLDGSYTPPEPFNDGSGWVTLAQIANWTKDGLKLSPESVSQLESATLALEDESNSMDFVLLRRVINTIDATLSNLFAGSLMLQNRLLSGEGAVRISFNSIYADSLALAKAIGGGPLADMTYTPVTGGKISGVLVGLSGLPSGDLGFNPSGAKQYKYGSRGTRNSFGNVALDQQQKIFATNKKQFDKTVNTMKHQAVDMVMFPQDSEVDEYLKLNKDGIKELKDKGINKSNAYEKLKMPVWLMMVEVFNVRNAIQQSDKNDIIYSLSNIISASADIGIAATATHNYLTQGKGKLASWSNASTNYQFKKGTIKRFGSMMKNNFVDIRLQSNITRLGMAGTFAGLFTAALAAWDTHRLIAKRDTDAAIGMGMFALGTAIASFSGTIFASSTTFLLLGPIGWIGLALALTGGLIVYLFTDTPIETWLSNGPFGHELTTSDKLKYLTNEPEWAYQQLLNQFVNLSLEVMPVDRIPYHILKREALEKQGVTHVLLVRNNLAQLLNMSDVQIKFEAQQVLEQVQLVKRAKLKYLSNDNVKESFSELTAWPVKSMAIAAVEQVEFAEGRAYFFCSTLKVPKSIAFYNNSVRYRINIDARVQLKVGDFIFPQPEMEVLQQVKNDLVKDANKYNHPDFSVESQPYWAKAKGV
ncbi:hypothetical protein [Vibrio fluminensis]|uniref:hypothetical protein n=1 Tax=Vibrio fluminensis TaxID=2783614 RepID=UPI001887C141|nr:hypothetical protein [Vibrio fluminensis]